LRIGVQDLPQQELGSDGDDFGFHAAILLNHSEVWWIVFFS
jgi:hypothetical protein